ncbi:MAG: type II secretion system protein [Acidobacteria bacterium]|nr:type II secretion system protein [Acidobacteriota bacterium]MBI3281430.1 type II secretion system protein [Acidobacteriota bacterium]
MRESRQQSRAGRRPCHSSPGANPEQSPQVHATRIFATESSGRPASERRLRSQCGLTLVELIVAFTIMALLTTMAVPLARYKVRRERERDLRYALHEIHTAIDKYKDASDTAQLGPVKIGTEGYPENLQVLVDGVKLAGQVDKKIRFLRRIPRDPFTNSTDWGLRSVQDDPESKNWGGQNVFAVYTKSNERAPDGTLYSDW